ncbi:unnamed protein product [Polarella glacialis]|uniref:Uncharacterized protein n=1 Tax=Polarella glacialis TaxID=89957 RepID=A0A813JXJ1_POLGL|nr:unnamed protein product [Polarella glacialis]
MLGLLPVAALPSRGKVPILPGAHSLHKLGGKLTHGSSTHSSLLFRNTSHPLSEIKEECTKDEFVAEIRKRILAENLFKGNWDHQPVASVLVAVSVIYFLLLLVVVVVICSCVVYFTNLVGDPLLEDPSAC